MESPSSPKDTRQLKRKQVRKIVNNENTPKANFNQTVHPSTKDERMEAHPSKNSLSDPERRPLSREMSWILRLQV